MTPTATFRSLTDADGNKDTFTYNALNLLTTANYGVSGSAAQNAIAYTYDTANRPVQAVEHVVRHRQTHL